MKVDLNGKVAVVTGSSRGIGRAIAEGFVRAGARVWFHGPTDAASDVTGATLCADGAYRHNLVRYRP